MKTNALAEGQFGHAKKMSESSGLGSIGWRRGNSISKPVEEADDTLSVEEATAALDALSLADHAKLQRISHFFAGSKDAAADLRQEAMLRTLEGTRCCPRGVQMVRHLHQVMRSIVCSDRRQARLHPLVEIEAVQPCDLLPGAIVTDPGPEVQAAEAEAVARVGKKVLGAFDDDEVARTLVEGIMLGFEGEELCELAGIDKTTLATKRRLIKRRIASTFPSGWNHDG